jgi:hypothetical protein
MNTFTSLKIDYQRLVFCIKRRIELHRLEKRKRDAVIEANRFKAVTGRQHKVLFLEGQYLVRSRRDLLELNKSFPRLAKLNTVEIDKFTVYTTK